MLCSPDRSELTYPDYKALLQAAEKISESGQTVEALIDSISMDCQTIACTNHINFH
jgi:ParB family chromosome partitioning protein